MNAVKKYTSTSKLPFRCFFPVIIWPGAVVLHTKSVMFRLLIFFALILSVINNIIAINIEKVFSFICGSLPAVTGFLKIILVFRVQLPLRGTRCWSTEVIRSKLCSRRQSRFASFHQRRNRDAINAHLSQLSQPPWNTRIER